MGGAISATTMGVLFDSCNQPSEKTAGNTKDLFSDNHKALITEISDIIIPTTDSPGAKAAGVGPFVAMMMNECYPEKAQKAFVDGLDDVEDRSKSKFSKSFMELSVAQRNEVIKSIADETVQKRKEDKEKEKKDADKQATTVKSKGTNDPVKNVYFFQLMRDLTLLGYFSSEVGTTKALAYVQVPGRYEGCTDLKPGQKAWAI
jgi:hypothetical protein